MATEQPDQHDIPDPGGSDDSQMLVDRSKIDFDPDDGLYSGTAVDGTSEIPGPHPDAENRPDQE